MFEIFVSTLNTVLRTAALADIPAGTGADTQSCWWIVNFTVIFHDKWLRPCQ
ncbi:MULTISPECIES: hypothetical protein [Winslowiella]|uniref:hypothetical protein n=1 Tax=Winslowiella TaxID=2997349 RepID=UPI0028BF3D6B|nr:hypothetical protein [Winslowiella toletana]WNN42527.1 hypothetical protein RIN69_12400 [Winslowiella toletana]